jgi:LytS/YehU family sensor histidine kinase
MSGVLRIDHQFCMSKFFRLFRFVGSICIIGLLVKQAVVDGDKIAATVAVVLGGLFVLGVLIRLRREWLTIRKRR